MPPLAPEQDPNTIRLISSGVREGRNGVGDRLVAAFVDPADIEIRGRTCRTYVILCSTAPLLLVFTSSTTVHLSVLYRPPHDCRRNYDEDSRKQGANCAISYGWQVMTKDDPRCQVFLQSFVIEPARPLEYHLLQRQQNLISRRN